MLTNNSHIINLYGISLIFKFTSFLSIISISWIILLSIKFSLIVVYIGLCINNLIFAVVYHFKINRIESNSLNNINS